MILYEEDFVKQGALVDYHTKNESFIMMHFLLKKMGIKNNKFFLALTQSELQGVDPHNVNDPTGATQLKIAYEIKVNPWYFIREVVRVPSQGSDPVQFKLDRANLALLWVFLNSVNVFLTMPRQCGKTVSTMALIAWFIYFAAQSTNIGLFARGTKLVQENVKRLKTIRDALPKYLITPSADDIDNLEGLDYKKLKNAYKTFVAQKDIATAADQGRGESMPWMQWDEFGYYINNHLSFPSASAVTDAAARQLRKTGVPCANIITTTAGRLDEKRGRYAYNIKSKALLFDEMLYDLKDREALEKLLKAQPEKTNMIYMEFSYLQLGHNQTWFDEVTSNKGQDEIKLDYLNIWISGSTEGILDGPILEKIKGSIISPKARTYVGDIIFNWYVDESTLNSDAFKRKPLIIGLDTSDNVGRDFTTVVIIDPTDMSVIGTCRTNNNNQFYIARALVKLMRDYPRAVLIPERNKNGGALIDFILIEMNRENFKPFRRIFNKAVQEFQDGDTPIDQLDSEGTDRKYLGFTTSGGGDTSSRDMLYKFTLMKTAQMNHSRIYDAILADEMCCVQKKNGRLDHSSAGHDDLLISYLLTCYVVYYGKNLHMYGIQPCEILSRVDNGGSVVEAGEKETQSTIQRRISELARLVEQTQSAMLKASYQRELATLKVQVKENLIDTNIVSMTQAKYDQVKDRTSYELNDPMCMRALYNLL